MTDDKDRIFDFGDGVQRRACAVLGHMPDPIMLVVPGGYALAIVCQRCRHYLV